MAGYFRSHLLPPLTEETQFLLPQPDTASGPSHGRPATDSYIDVHSRYVGGGCSNINMPTTKESDMRPTWFLICEQLMSLLQMLVATFIALTVAFLCGLSSISDADERAKIRIVLLVVSCTLTVAYIAFGPIMSRYRKEFEIAHIQTQWKAIDDHEAKRPVELRIRPDKSTTQPRTRQQSSRERLTAVVKADDAASQRTRSTADLNDKSTAAALISANTTAILNAASSSSHARYAALRKHAAVIDQLRDDEDCVTSSSAVSI